MWKNSKRKVDDALHAQAGDLSELGEHAGLPAAVMGQIRRIQIRTNRIVDEILAGQYHSVFKGQGMEFKEVREYAPGDDVRAIDWNVTARTGRPHIKVLAEERELTVMLVVDMSGSERFGSLERMKQELVAELCAVLAFSAIRNNDKVGLLIFSQEMELYVPPKKGRKHVLRVIREVLLFEPAYSGTNMAGALHFMNNILKRRAVVFLLSDFMCSDYKNALLLAKRRHDVIAVTVTDPREELLPNVGPVAIQDTESGRESWVDTADPAVRSAYARVAQKRAQQRDLILQQARVDVMHLRTDTPYVDELHRFFRMRERRLA